MKNIVQKSFVRHTVPSRLGKSLAFMAVLAGSLLAGAVAQATPVNVLWFPLTNSPGNTFPSDTDLGGVSVTLTSYNSAGTTPIDLSGIPGSGVNGAVSGMGAMCLTNGEGILGDNNHSANNNGAANAGGIKNNAALSMLVTNFIVSMWINEPTVYSDATGNLLPRIFVLSTAGGNDDSANSIGCKFQVGNQLEFEVNNALTTTGNQYNNPANSAAMGASETDFLPNKWYFVAWVYDSTNIYHFTGSDSAASTLQYQFAAANLSVNLGATPWLVLGNRNVAGSRGVFGKIQDFRFYTNVVSGGNNAAFVESIRASIAPKLPTITGVEPDGLSLMQNSNCLTFTAKSTSGLNLTNIDLKLNGVDVTASCTFVTNDAPATHTNVTVTYCGLPQQQTNIAVMSATDASGIGSSTSVGFDTFSSNNLVIKAEEFNFNSGSFIDNPDYTATNTSTQTPDPYSYQLAEGTEGIDVHKGQSTGDNTDYRWDADAPAGIDTQTPASTDVPWPRFPTGLLDAAGNPIVSHQIGNWSSAEWQNYTKTFPSGSYNVWARVTTSSGSTIVFSQVTSDPTQPNQTTTVLGSFTYTGNGTYQWVPLRHGGTLATVNLAGVNTVRATSGGGANANFYMLVPANPNLPTITGLYPDGDFLFETTNKLVFTVSSGVAINTANIALFLNGTNESGSLTFVANGPDSWNCSYTGLVPNMTYNAVINVTDNNSFSANATYTFDTWNPIMQIEAEDFDFDPTKSSAIGDTETHRYIDGAVPTGPLVAQNNSYEGQVGDIDIDEHGNVVTNTDPVSAHFAGATLFNYRTNDPCATTAVTDTPRKQFVGTGANDYNVGFLGPGHWEQYTRTWSNGTFNVYARMASGANLGNIYSSWSQVLTNWGTTNQVTKHVGSFTIPTAGGYSTYVYVPMHDIFGNLKQLTLSGTTNTFRDTHLVFNNTETANGASFGLNINFYMLVTAVTNLPRIDNVYPDGTVLLQQTNTLSFVASSLTAGLAQSGIGVTLNGATITPQLVFSGSSPSFNVSYPGLLPNATYSAVISVTDLVNQVATTTVNFDTFSSKDFQWEAEDFDYDPSLSQVPNGTGLRYTDNPILTDYAAANSYYEQTGDGGQIIAGPGQLTTNDYSALFFNIGDINTLFRTNDSVPIEVTGDTARQSIRDAILLQGDPRIQDFDIYNITNHAWANYTRTFPSGGFNVYAHLSAGATLTNCYLAQVTSGAGTVNQTTNILGYFRATGNAFASWQYAPLINTNGGALIVVNFPGTPETFQLGGDSNEHVNFFLLAPVFPAITATISGANVNLSFPTDSGFTYTIQYKNNLTDPTWTNLSGGGNPVAGDGSVHIVTDTHSLSYRFYRLSIQ